MCYIWEENISLLKAILVVEAEKVGRHQFKRDVMRCSNMQIIFGKIRRYSNNNIFSTFRHKWWKSNLSGTWPPRFPDSRIQWLKFFNLKCQWIEKAHIVQISITKKTTWMLCSIIWFEWMMRRLDEILMLQET